MCGQPQCTSTCSNAQAVAQLECQRCQYISIWAWLQRGSNKAVKWLYITPISPSAEHPAEWPSVSLTASVKVVLCNHSIYSHTEVKPKKTYVRRLEEWQMFHSWDPEPNLYCSYSGSQLPNNCWNEQSSVLMLLAQVNTNTMHYLFIDSQQWHSKTLCYPKDMVRSFITCWNPAVHEVCMPECLSWHQ